MSTITEVKFGPWPLGMDNVSPDTALLGTQVDAQGGVHIGAVRDAQNGTFDRNGYFIARPSMQTAQAGTGMNSLWTSEATGVSYFVQGTTLYRVAYNGTLHATALGTVPGPLSYCDLNGEVYITARGWIGVIRATGILDTVGVETPANINAIATLSGGLNAGNYMIGITYLAGYEESGMSRLVNLAAQEGGGITILIPTAIESKVTKCRIYLTNTNGDTPYFYSDVPTGATVNIGKSPLGRSADTWGLSRMPGGSLVRAWRGRLLIALNDTLWYSEPMRYGLTSLRHNFVWLRSITLLEPVEGGVYVGTIEGVWFLGGTGPGDWTLQRTSGKPPVAGSGTHIPAHLLSPDLAAVGTHYALWLSETGYVLGGPAGQINEIQRDRIKLDIPAIRQASTVVVDRHIYTLVN